MGVFRYMQERGLIYQQTDDGIDAFLDAAPRRVYVGFDPSADNLHIGNLVALMGLMRLQRAGHRPIAVVGGGTGMVGDPSGRDEERLLMSVEEIETNCAAIQKICEHFLDFDDPKTGALLCNNLEWLGKFGFLEFLREVGKHFSVNAMLAKESIRSRLDDRQQGLSYTEFSYMLLQAYDYQQVFDAHKCELQLGGSDQWGNIVAGIDLIRRTRGAEVYGATFPLILKADGTKFGKSVGGAIWLGAHGTSPYDLYQFLMRTNDADVSNYLRIFTFLSDAELRVLEEEVAETPEKRTAQRILADEVVRLVHGEAGLKTARKATEVLYGGDVTDLTDDEVAAIFHDVASTELERQALAGAGLPLADALVAAGVVPSKGAARRLVAGGGVYVNNARVTQEDATLTAQALASKSYIVLRKGKKDFYLLRFTG